MNTCDLTIDNSNGGGNPQKVLKKEGFWRYRPDRGRIKEGFGSSADLRDLAKDD
jgi:hypothetical protein